MSIKSLNLNQTTQFQKNAGDQERDNSTLSGFEKYLGSYAHPSMNLTIKVVVVDEGMAIQIGEENPVQLTNSDNLDKWFLKNGDSKYLRFNFNADGRVKTLNIVDMLIIPRSSTIDQEEK